MTFDNTDLIRHLLSCGALLFSEEGFVSKSGGTFHYETDIRTALSTNHDADATITIIATLIRRLPVRFQGILGVPETGTLLSTMLAVKMLQMYGTVLEFNALRATPKVYQFPSSDATILPLRGGCQWLLIEDDVVSGASLRRSLDACHSRGIEVGVVVSVIDRVCSQTSMPNWGLPGLPLFSLIPANDLLSMALQEGCVPAEFDVRVRRHLDGDPAALRKLR